MKNSILNRIVVLAASVVFSAGLFAQAPDSVGDSLLYASLRDSALHRNQTRSVRLNANGTFRENWEILGSSLTFSVYGVAGEFGVPKKGTYTYVKATSNTATLVLTPDDASGTVTFPLTFTSSTEGTYVDQTNSIADARFTLQSNLSAPVPLVNISTRAQVHNGESCIVGFVVGREGDFLVRGIGPGLAQFDVKNVWATPNFVIRDNAGGVYHPWGPTTGAVVSADKAFPPTWDHNAAYLAMHTAAFQASGEFALQSGSTDVAAVVHLTPGNYTVEAHAYDADVGGEALIEVTQIP